MSTIVTVDWLQQLRENGEDAAALVEFDDDVIDYVRDMIQPAAEMAVKGEAEFRESGAEKPDNSTDPTICDSITEAALAGTAMFGIQIGIALAKLESETDNLDKEDGAPDLAEEERSSTTGIIVTPDLISAAAEAKLGGSGPDVEFDTDCMKFLANRFGVITSAGIPGDEVAATAYQVGFRHGVMTGEEL